MFHPIITFSFVNLFFLSSNVFLDNGIVLKVITIYNQETESMEEVILEELQVFKVNCAVYEVYKP